MGWGAVLRSPHRNNDQDRRGSAEIQPRFMDHAFPNFVAAVAHKKRQEILRSLSAEQLRELERLHLAGDEEALNRYWRECLRGFFSEGSEPPRI